MQHADWTRAFQVLGRVSTRSFDKATGSVIANVTPDRSHASRVNASASKPGGSPPGACVRIRDEVRTSLLWAAFGLLAVSLIVFINNRCATQTPTSSIHLKLDLLYAATQLNQGTLGG